MGLVGPAIGTASGAPEARASSTENRGGFPLPTATWAGHNKSSTCCTDGNNEHDFNRSSADEKRQARATPQGRSGGRTHPR